MGITGRREYLLKEIQDSTSSQIQLFAIEKGK